MLVGQVAEAGNLLIGHHVARRIGRAGEADRTHFVRDLQAVEVDLILEEVILETSDPGTIGPKEILFQADLRIADVFRGKRQQDLFAAIVAATAGKEIEEVEETVLASVGEGNVLGPEIPPKLVSEKLGQSLDE